MGSYWRPLQLSSTGAQTPPLLVKYEFGLAHYRIYLSDLTYIWTESLERKQIVKRALNVDTSIDPSESGDQLQLLLRNIRKALDAEEGAAVSLSNSGISEQLILRTTTPLPGALNPLVWPIHLVSAPQQVLTTELLLPGLSFQSLVKAQIVSLVQQIKEKDHVINRLTEKMQSDGSDLGKVFPGASNLKSGAKLNSRESASKFVKGLGEFDSEQWRKGFFDSIQRSSDLATVLYQVFTSELEDLPELTVSNNKSGAWWQGLNHKESQVQEGLNSSNFLSSKPAQSPLNLHSPADSESGSVTDPNFQRQTTPSRIRTKAQDYRGSPTTYPSGVRFNSLEQTNSIHGDTTTDESDKDLDSSILNHNAGKKPVQRSSTILSRSSSVAEADLSILKAENPRKCQIKPNIPTHGQSEYNRANSDEEHNAMDLPKVTTAGSENLSPRSSPKSKPKIGKIGGRGKPEKASDLSRPKIVSLEAKSIPSRGRKYPATLDTEVKPEFSLPADHVDSLRNKRTSLPPELPSPPRETSQERANSRREHLKRELERNAKAGSKKKRKF